jgi:hypothetical protein
VNYLLIIWVEIYSQEDPDKPRKPKGAAASLEKGGGSGLNPLAILVLLIAIAAGIWFSNQTK